MIITSVLDCRELMSSWENRTGDSLRELAVEGIRTEVHDKIPRPDLRLRRRGRFRAAGSHLEGCEELQWQNFQLVRFREFDGKSAD